MCSQIVLLHFHLPNGWVYLDITDLECESKLNEPTSVVWN